MLNGWVSRISSLVRDRAHNGPDFSRAPNSPKAPDDTTAQLAALVESTEDAIIGKDMHGVITSWNAGAERLFGYSAAEAIGRPIHFLFPPDRRDEEIEIMTKLSRGERIEHFDTVRVRKDGTPIDVSVTISPVRDASGRVVGAAKIARDITEKKRNEERAQRHYAELRALNTVTATINELWEIEAILDRVLEQIIALVAADAVECHLCNLAGELELVSAHNFPDAFLAATRELRFATDQGIPGHALATGAPVFVPDLQKDPRYLRREIASKAGLRSLLCVPMFGRDGMLGTVTVYSRQRREFTEEEQTLLIIIGRELAVAVERARLFAAERQRTTELDRSNTLIITFSRVAARVAMAPDPDAVMASLGAELDWLGVKCAIALLDDPKQALVIRYASPHSSAVALAEKLTGRQLIGFRLMPEHFPIYEELVKRQQPVFVEDTSALALSLLPDLARSIAERALQLAGVHPDTHSYYLPLVIENRLFGILALWGAGLRRADLAAVSVFANQVAIALENARLLHQVQWLAVTDDLTGLYNRRHFNELAEREIQIAQRYQHPVSLILMDLDHFKQINDLYGHATGDEALRAVAERCRECVRSVDILARYGGEEFTILLPETSHATALEVAERLRHAIVARAIASEKGSLSLTVSIGLAATAAPGADLNLPTWLDQADRAMYAAKQAGGNQIKTRML